MKTKLLYPLIFLLLLCACGSDDDPTPSVEPEQPEPAAICYVQEAVTTADGLTTTEKYTYNEQRQLVKTEHFTGGQLQGITEHQYDGKGRLLRENILSAAGEVTGAVRYEVNTRNQIVKFTTYEAWLGGALIPKNMIDCLYDSTVVLRTVNVSRFANNKPVKQASTKYTYKGNSIMHTATVSGSDAKVSDKITMVFDNKHAPMFGVQQLMKTKYVTPGYPFAHNIQSYAVLDAENKEKPAASYTSAYSYNTQGYPEQVTVTYGDKKIKTIAYTYLCP